MNRHHLATSALPGRIAGSLVASLLAAGLLLGACSSDGSSGEGSSATTEASHSTTTSSETDADQASSTSTSVDGDALATREVKAGGLDSDLCEGLDTTPIDSATGLDFGYLSGEEVSESTYGSVSCIFGLAEASTNYLYVDWQVRSQAFAADNYAKEVADATETVGEASSYEHGDWDDASLILNPQANLVRVIVLDDNAVYSVRLSLAQDMADRGAVAEAIEPFLEQLAGKVLE